MFNSYIGIMRNVSEIAVSWLIFESSQNLLEEEIKIPAFTDIS